jgi:uncharacterized repeat protein (TIGR01451 family)
VITRIAAVIGVVTFLVLAGTTASLAYWSSQAATHTTVSASSLSTNCTNPVMLVNGGIELPVTTGGIENKATIPGWSIAPVSSNPTYEIWRNYDGATAAVGSQFLELNGNGPDTLYQEVSAAPGQVLTWSVLHRGRWGNDTMYVAIDPAGSSSYTYQIPTGASATAITTGTGTWKRYSGVYVVPASQAANVKTRFALVPGTTTQSNGSTSVTDRSVGNLVDDISFGSGPCLSSVAAFPGTTVTPGAETEITTTITNTGGAIANGTMFSAPLPAGTTFVAGSISVSAGAGSYDAGSNTIKAGLGFGGSATVGGTVAPGVAITVKFKVAVPLSAAGSTLAFTSSTSYVDAAVPQWPLAVASAPVSVTVAQIADLVTTLTSSRMSNVNPRIAEWVFTVANQGGVAANSVSVALSLSRSLTDGNAPNNTPRAFQWLNGATWSNCSGTSSTSRTCGIGNLAAGASVQLRIQGTPYTSERTYTGTAAASTSTAQASTTNDTASGTLTVDTADPTTPTGLAAVRQSETAVQLSWNASTDTDSGVAGYKVYRNGQLVTTVAGTSFTDQGLTSSKPYWYWVVAVDNQGNESGQSAGDGAVTYIAGASYRIQYQNNTALCVTASNANNAQAVTGSCTTTASANRQWVFETVAGDTAYIRFATGDARRWSIASDTTTNTPVIMLDTGATSYTAARTQWRMDVYWVGNTPYVEIRNVYGSSNTSTGMCLDVTSASTTAGAVLQQYTCNQTVAQRFLLVQP